MKWLESELTVLIFEYNTPRDCLGNRSRPMVAMYVYLLQEMECEVKVRSAKERYTYVEERNDGRKEWIEVKVIAELWYF